ncbi:MAG: DUF2892 domain-containing protein [Candidatus Didemnitutus sp.]|nr:DUF2892 domain-containing protein [Candidatus Didemnitutus sp.]
MKTNIGSYDAGARFVLGCVILFLGVRAESWWGAVGFVPLVTAFLGYCPLYWPFRWDTKRFD